MDGKKYAIIVAGGKGTRINSPLPKQFMLLSGIPILMHTLKKFHECFPETELILVLPDDQFFFWDNLCKKHNFTLKHTIVKGGNTRFQSVKNGLELVKEEGIIAVHDGVRPLVSKELIKQAFLTAQKYGNAIPSTPVNESLRKFNGDKNIPVDRSLYMLIQTPQCFSSAPLKKAYEFEENASFTDDASVFESSGHEIVLIPGEPGNIKITVKEDLLLAEALLKFSKSESLAQ
jgi:2-C-methyl-D-erythritol 4-phosphate cytidylyltransferase